MISLVQSILYISMVLTLDEVPTGVMGQIPDEFKCISHGTNTLKNVWILLFFLPAIGK